MKIVKAIILAVVVAVGAHFGYKMVKTEDPEAACKKELKVNGKLISKECLDKVETEEKATDEEKTEETE